MRRLHLLPAAICCALTSFAQKTDTLVIHYKPDQFIISKQDKVKLDSFISRGWDRLFIRGYTDETEGEEYNLELSRKRSGEVYNYFMTKKIPATSVNTEFFGEAMPKADNNTDDGRAVNRRTEIVGYQFPRISMKPPVATDIMRPVTRTLDNGIIITYRPGLLPDYLAENFARGSGSNIRMITNTTEMRNNNLFNNTTNGEILSSVMILCGERLQPCKLDSPVLIKVPIPFQTECPITNVKFFNAKAEKGRKIWEEQNKKITAEVLGGQQYVGVLMDDFCECINFDFKIDTGCYDLDSTMVLYTKGSIKNLTAELIGFNSVYMPRQLDDSTQRIVFMKNKIARAPLSFALYEGKRRIKGYKDKLLSSFPYDSVKGKYILGSGKQGFYFPKLDVWDVVLTVNGDRYRVPEEKNRFDFTYLAYKKDSILVDFTVIESKKRMVVYRNQSLSSLPYDSERGCYVIDRKFIRELRQRTAIAKY